MSDRHSELLPYWCSSFPMMIGTMLFALTNLIQHFYMLGYLEPLFYSHNIHTSTYYSIIPYWHQTRGGIRFICELVVLINYFLLNCIHHANNESNYIMSISIACYYWPHKYGGSLICFGGLRPKIMRPLVISFIQICNYNVLIV